MAHSERIYKIKTMLRPGRVVSFEALLSALNVSRSTLKRDLDALRKGMNAPIKYDREAGGYCLNLASTHPGQAHELPGLWFSPREIHALLTMQHLLTSLDAGGVLAPHIDPLMTRLNALLGSAQNDAQEVRKRVHIITLARRQVQAEHFQTVGTALLQRKRLAITYTARHNNQTTQRDVSPQRLVHYRENWYLDAWCHLRQELRNFALDRITQAQVLPSPAQEQDPAALQAAFASSYGIFSGGPVTWATLRFSPERARWVAQEQWHDDQHASTQPDGSYHLQIPYTDHRELIMDILKHGAHCEVLEPQSLRSAVVEEVKRMGEKYL
jgi:predicted DNA-binding transcriptional regulator YafY